ncbi:hypothetical protein NDU88_002199 [Pleurodeles waltl]|uniref:Uncharacterized protein n=1 Tax=Pleurodeles waltl TaxID=8319 RepID=A0AAV7TJW5_PLEWA|nr:hypothetical protein NDU88_002199 [Pleurodeles waltl]
MKILVRSSQDSKNKLSVSGKWLHKHLERSEYRCRGGSGLLPFTSTFPDEPVARMGAWKDKEKQAPASDQARIMARAALPSWRHTDASVITVSLAQLQQECSARPSPALHLKVRKA